MTATLVAERWAQVPGFEGRYDVSNLGRVRSWLLGAGPRILRASPNRNGYPQLTLCLDGQRSTPGVHKLVALAFLGPRPEGREVRHLDGNRLNSALVNLTYGTKAENSQDSIGHGTHVNAGKTHCKHGHAYDEANTRVDSRGWRWCRTCHREAERVARRWAS
jgi:hypothetical protein